MTQRTDTNEPLLYLALYPPMFFGYILPVLTYFTVFLILASSGHAEARLSWVIILFIVPGINWIGLGLGMFSPERSMILGTCATWAMAGLIGHTIAQGRLAERRALAKRNADAAARANAMRAAIAALNQLLREVYTNATQLPILLAEAGLVLARAEEELKRGLYSPFWEAMEEAALKIAELQQTLLAIANQREAYRTQAAVVRDAPPFVLGVTVLPDASEVRTRATRLYREAQANPHFAIVYEQRRTNTILIAGFRSLGQALDQLGDRIVTAVADLGASLDCRLTSVEASLRSVAASAEEQNATLRKQLEQSRAANDDINHQLRLDADNHADQGRKALRMLDNLQRGRKPTVFDGL